MVAVDASPLAESGSGLSGGLNVHVAELSRALAGRGHEVRVYTRRDAAKPARDVSLLADGVTVERVSTGPAKPLSEQELLPHLGDFGRRLAELWHDESRRPDVIHAHLYTSGLAALTATAKTRIPVVETFHFLASVRKKHEGDNASGPEPRAGLERQLGRLADRVIAQSEDEVAELGRLGVNRADLVVVPPGVDLDQFRPDGPAMDRDPDRRRILGVGRLVERKGFADLVMALRRVPDAELVIVGGPDKAPEAKRLKGLAERGGVADRLRLVGPVSHKDLAAWYRSADVLACAPWYEPFGLSPLEAMACGVPVVAYSVGGIAESVIDGVTGTLVPPRDVNALAAALRDLLGDQVRRMSFASAAADRVRSRYTWDRTAFEVERVYAAATGQSGEADERDEAGSEDGTEDGTEDGAEDGAESDGALTNASRK
jgi:D-inositol-3-phosphate glycosyltransferase